MATAKITKRTVDSASAGDRDRYVWDTELRGFGLKITSKGTRTYLVQYRIGGRRGRTRRVTIGRHGVVTADQARVEAKALLRLAGSRKDPAEERTRLRQEPSVSDVADRYLAEHVAVRYKPSTAAEATRIVETKIKPRLGRKRLSELTRAHVKAWHAAMSATPYEANRALAYLSKMLSLASEDWALIRGNPCKGLERFPEKRRESYIADDGLKRLGAALRNAEDSESVLPGALHAIRLLLFTGCRRSEILRLRWCDVDLERRSAVIRDAKAGTRTIPLSMPAVALLGVLDRDGGYVLHGVDPFLPLSPSALRAGWMRVRARAGLDGVRLHDLRHTMGTYAAQAGANAFVVRDLLGHRTLAMTGRYVERATDPLRATTDAVSARVQAALEGRDGAEVVAIPRHGRAGQR